MEQYNYTVREAAAPDLDGLLRLYTHLHEKTVPEHTPELAVLWARILSDTDHHIIIAEADGKVVSSCVCAIVPNLTHGPRPYALIENVVTHADYRGRGMATSCLNFARAIAESQDCYKTMLITGTKEQSTLDFYAHAGYSSEGKTAFYQLLD